MELKPKIKLFIEDNKFIELHKNPADGMQKQSGHVVLLWKHMISKECKSRYYKSIQQRVQKQVLQINSSASLLTTVRDAQGKYT